ncbi:hypothetical protein F4561_005186 [Lipingzhangella halophila]|uniref:ANTAR domain-containing protein n=1 Tax=Lipingzhangella halophila TaxID=1783352 RepID=A0A7W7W513_9ACTN|nr:GAF and ANTAR domain-containing protein [Lipingzhangella halophila]MBB4934366.1 hypothetical protein [Lipingzhangella halophila]
MADASRSSPGSRSVSGSGVPAQALSRVRTDVDTALRDDAGGFEAVAVVGRACVELLGIDGASVSVVASARSRQMLYASDAVSDWIESLQFDFGEGPCYEAFDSRVPVLAPDLAASATASWPVFAAAVTERQVGAIFAFPVLSGAISLGSVDLYRVQPGWLASVQLTTALYLVDIAALALRGISADPVTADNGILSLSRDREQVHQATGMVLAALDVSAASALDRLRGYAFARGCGLEEVAADIVARRLAPTELDS